MALNESATFVVSLLLAVLTFSSMQVLKPTLSGSQGATIAGGAMGSAVFLFLLTALANLEKTLLGKHFAAKWPEVVLCLVVAVASSASVHRVCATTCAGFSLALLYGAHKISQDAYEAPAPGAESAGGAGGDGGGRGKKRK